MKCERCQKETSRMYCSDCHCDDLKSVKKELLDEVLKILSGYENAMFTIVDDHGITCGNFNQEFNKIKQLEGE